MPNNPVDRNDFEFHPRELLYQNYGICLMISEACNRIISNRPQPSNTLDVDTIPIVIFAYRIDGLTKCRCANRIVAPSFIIGVSTNKILFGSTLGVTCSFFWLGVLIVGAAILQGLLSSSSPGMYALAVFIMVVIQEFSRVGLYLLHRRGFRLLSDAASKSSDLVVNPSDEGLIAAAAGFGHAAAHSLLFSVAWLPLASGKGVLYTSQCTSMSWAPAAAFTMLGFYMLHTSSMVVAFLSLTSGKLYQAGAVSLVHLCAALLTLANLSGDHCVAIAVAEFCIGMGPSVAAAVVMRQQARDARQYTRVTQAEQSEQIDQSDRQ